MDVHIRAFGGTGGLIARAFVLSLMTDPISIDPGDPINEIHVYRMDLDTDPGPAAAKTDYGYLGDVCVAYEDLRNMGLTFTSNIPLFLDKRKDGTNSAGMREIRDSVYAIPPAVAADFDYSLEKIFARNDPIRKQLLLSVLDEKKITDPNKAGCYGDLATNAIIARPMIDNKGFDGEVKKLELNSANSVVFYLGSTDGGLANTMIDPELMALHKVMYDGGALPLASVYSIRTLPYKSFPTNSNDPEQERRAKDMEPKIISKSAGVMKNILASNVPPYDIYYKRNVMAITDPYILDGLVLVGYNVNRTGLDDTNVFDETKLDNQQHCSHAVEFASAMSMVDILNGQVSPNAGDDSVYGYQVSAPADGNMLALGNFIKAIPLKMKWFGGQGHEINIDVFAERKMRAFIHLYACVVLNLMQDFAPDVTTTRHENAKPYVSLFNNMNKHPFFVEKQYDSQIMAGMRECFERFENNAFYFVQMIEDIQRMSLYGKNNPMLNFVSQEAINRIIDGEPNLTYSFAALAATKGHDNSWDVIASKVYNDYPKYIKAIYNQYSTDPEYMACRLLEIVYQIIYETI